MGYLRMNIVMNENVFLQSIGKEGLECTVVGEVYGSDKTEYGYRIFLKKIKTEYTDKNGGIRCVVYSDKKYDRGDVIRVTGRAERFTKPSNPGEFDSETYYESLKIRFKIYAESTVLIQKNNNPIYKLADSVSERVTDVFYNITDEKNASVFTAIILGNKDDLDSGIYSLFSSCGIGHILAISGLHISMIGMGIYKLIRRVGGKDTAGFIISGSIIIFYGIITGNGISTTRALIMYLIGIFSNVPGRTYDLITGSALAAIILLMDSPMLIYNTGFLLSFSAIGGIGIINPAIIKFFKSPNSFHKALISGISIQLSTLPVIMYSYFEVPIYATFLNLLVIPLMTVLMISALLAGVLGNLSVVTGRFCIGPAVYILKLYEFLCNICSRLPGAVWIAGRPKVWQIYAYYLILGLVLFLLHRHSYKRYVAGIFAALLIVSLRFNKSFETVFLDVGQGDGIFIYSKGSTILIDGGSSDRKSLYDYTLEPFLLSKGVDELDCVFVTHPDEDHISGLLELLQKGRIKVDILYMPSIGMEDKAYKELWDLAQASGARVETVCKGMTFNIGETTISCLHPEKGYVTNERNSYSTVLDIKYKNFGMLLTGDISSDEEKHIISAYSSTVNVLKAAHHGSGYSNSQEFLQTVLPECVVISCGEDNDYGHPHADTLERLDEISAKVFRTDESGAIEIKVSNDTVVVSGYVSE